MPSEYQFQQAAIGAERLREVQSSSAHLLAAKRRAYLRSELAEIIAGEPEDERLELLEELAGHFPDEGGAQPEDAASSEARVLDQFRQTLECLTGPARESFSARASAMLEKGFAQEKQPIPAGGDLEGMLRYDAEHLPHLKLALTVLKSDKLQSAAPGALDLLNLVKTAAALIEAFGGIEAVFWKIWKAKAPNSPRQGPFGDGFLKETACLLEGKSGASFAGYGRSVSESGQMVVALLSAIPTALDRMANEWLDRFAPERIATEVRRAEGGSPGGQPEQRFWREYEYRCNDFTPARLSESFFRHLTESAAAMVKF